MKKLFKAVVFTVVMCMLLSTAAFAAGTGEATGNNGLIQANVANVGANEQVVILIVANTVTDLSKATEADIMYINQAQANSAGVAVFEDIAIKDTNTVVDVYVGSGVLAEPRLVGDDIELTEEVKAITIVGSPITTYGYSGTNNATKGFAAAITVNIPNGLTVDKMIWGFTLSSDAQGVRRYSEAYTPTSTAVSGDVQYAAAFDLGATADVDDVEVSNVSAIFLTTDGGEHYTNESLDKPNKKTN